MKRADRDSMVASRRNRALAAFIAGSVGSAGAAHAVVFGQIDDFENGTVMNWTHGDDPPAGPNPTNVATGGPGGANDNYLRNYSTGSGEEHSRQIMFNEDQWAGNYNSAGVTRISGFMNNLGSATLNMRVAVQLTSTSTWWSSTTPVVLSPGSGWQPVTFDLTPASMTRVQGTATLESTLANVSVLRILSSAAPSFRGDQINSILGADNLRAQTRPGDANLDRVINLADFNILASNFGTTSGATWQQADFNFDGIVNLADFNALAANFGQSFGPGEPSPDDWATLGAAVPEPATGIAGALLAGATLARRRRR